METPVYDVIVVGAGLSGIGAGYHLQNDCPEKSYVILEGRANLGGTWDLFKYPGIRSDSDMYTLGYSFNPWKNPKAIADGPSILEYIEETAEKFGINQKIRYNHKVIDASWNDDEQMWTISVAEHEKVENTTLKCRFLLMCSGYYDYDQGYTPEFPGREQFQGQIIHPQKWSPEIDYKDKKVVVIGSGATAVTLVPEMAKQASHVTMLQRTPTYIMSLPGKDSIATFLNKILPGKAAYQLSRWKNILVSLGLFKASRQWPNGIKRLIQKAAKKQLGEKYRQEDFNPPYKPWDQRLCVVPNGDLFKAIKSGKADIVTGKIRQFEADGIRLENDQMIEADMVLTATGLKVKLLGGMTMHINGELGDPSKTHAYRGVMFSDVPNFAFTVGYTNASWTLKCDLSCRFVTKLLNYMDKNGHSVCTPRFDKEVFETEPLLDFNAGYVLRAADILPKQGSGHPWKVYQNYVRDLISLKWSSVNDKYLEYR